MKHGTFFGYFECENNRPGAEENLLEVLKKYRRQLQYKKQNDREKK